MNGADTTDAVKVAIDALTDIRTSIECAAGCDEGIDPMAAVSEIMSAYGTAMASAYSRAADMVNILAALEQAGEPVADETFAFAQGIVGVANSLQGRDAFDSEIVSVKLIRACAQIINGEAFRRAGFPTLGQEFDAGEVKPEAFLYEKDGERFVALHNSFGVEEWTDEDRSSHTGEGWAETPLYAHPPQFRGQAFDGEGEAFRPMETWDKRDETVLLLVDYSDGENPLDDALTAITIGHNNDHNVGDGEGNGWEFAGWNWQQDYYTHGRGKPIGWIPIPHHRAALSEAREAGAKD